MHIPVLVQEVLESLDIQRGQALIDCNLNRAGHSMYFAQALGDTGVLIGIDLDTNALEEAQKKLSTLAEHPRICLMHYNFRDIDKVLEDTGVTAVHKVFFDLGLSSEEIDISGRGFTFQKDEPLLMTYNSIIQEDTLTARDIVNLWSEETLADIIYNYSDEQFSRRIAKAIVARRVEKPFETTFDLVETIESAVPSFYRHRKTHCATKTFQALRIATNDEIGALHAGLEKAWNVLLKDGRIAALTFHSLEDRVVKQFFKQKVQNGEGLLLYKKAVTPRPEELRANPRSRSAQLRAICKL